MQFLQYYVIVSSPYHKKTHTVFLRSDTHGYYFFFFGAGFCAAAIQGQLLFKVGIYFLEKPTDITDS